MSLPTTIPVTRSIFDTAALATQLIWAYPIQPPLVCHFWSGAMNDTYLVESATERSVLRVTRSYWRSHSELNDEVAFLQFLVQQGLPVAHPILRRDGQMLTVWQAPEGACASVLFTYAHGRPLTVDERDSWLLGGALATLHTGAEAFPSLSTRRPLDLDTLLEQPLGVIQPYVQGRAGAWSGMQATAHRVRTHLRALGTRGLDQGMCHGDAYHGNAHLDSRGTITLFDFDCCGIGWRAYDLAVVRSTIELAGVPMAAWEAFLAGYQQQRPLRGCDLAAIPLLVAARRIWHMSVQVQHSLVWGTAWLDTYFDRALVNLHQWMATHGDEAE